MTDLRKLQMVELDLMCEVDRICRKYHLRYYLCAGTLLGAVRHKGFIPWDDDIDVAMPQDDYKKFCKACKTEMDEAKYFLQNLENDPEYLYIFAKLRRVGTLYVRNGQEHMDYNHGICIDIFPLVPVPDRKWLNFCFVKIVKWCKTIMWSPIGAISEKKTRLRFVYRMLSHIPKRIPLHLINAMVSRCGKKRLIAISAPSYGRRRYTKKWDLDYQMREAIEMEFEGHNFFVPNNYDLRLQDLYGDYMKLPPEHERIGHHVATTIDFGDALDDILLTEEVS